MAQESRRAEPSRSRPPEEQKRSVAAAAADAAADAALERLRARFFPPRDEDAGSARARLDSAWRSRAVAHEGGGRGRRAAGPGEIPARGWKDILLRVKD